MNNVIALGLLVAGATLTLFGVSEMNSLTSDLSRIFTGVPTDRSIWMTTGGIALMVCGFAGFLFGGRSN